MLTTYTSIKAPFSRPAAATIVRSAVRSVVSQNKFYLFYLFVYLQYFLNRRRSRRFFLNQETANDHQRNNS
jgi:hypothetical protein